MTSEVKEVTPRGPEVMLIRSDELYQTKVSQIWFSHCLLPLKRHIYCAKFRKIRFFDLSEVNEVRSDYFSLLIVGMDLKNSTWKIQLSISFRCGVIKKRIAYLTDSIPFSLTVLLMKKSPTLSRFSEESFNTREKTKPVLKSVYPRLHLAPV